MNPSLSILSGPRAGETVSLDRDELTIGRNASNDLQLADLAVSRRHCVLHRSDRGFTVRDLDSLHGTFVNGLPVRERELINGDRIVVGESTLVLVLGTVGDEAANGGGASKDRTGESITGESTVALALDDSRFLDPGRLRTLEEDLGETTQALSTLLSLSSELQSLVETSAVGQALVTRLLEIAPADRASLFLREAGADDFSLAALDSAQGANGTSGDEPVLSRTVQSKVVAGRIALLATEVATDGAVADAESVQAAGLRSLLCVPLASADDTFGLLYLESWSPGRRFSQRHLELVTAVGRLATGSLAAARRQEHLQAENRRLADAALGHGLIGESSAMRKVATLIQRVAATESTVLIRGESGTGKEVAARAIHLASPRSRRPFLAINCASLSEQLLESELFGHERGAFTGAVSRQVGKLEAADGGTVFLDELGELPFAQQAKLLRVLEERSFVRVGATRPVRVDIRLLAATNRDLEAAVAEGRFREDLYYRLNVITLEMPPLRERKEDVPLLARHFARNTGERLGRRISGISEEALRLLRRYDWPGNVRELANAIERALVLGLGDMILAEDLPETLLEDAPPAKEGNLSYHEALNREKARIILDAVSSAEGNVTRAAEQLQIHPNHLHRLISNLGLRESLRD